jgi:NADP-dependent 3-hydroxy acid dehydrogenase YdfG
MKKVVLITGASSGMGKATALLLVQAGYIVYAGARRIEKMNDLKKEGAKILHMDVTDDRSMVSGIEESIKNEER